MPKERPGVLSIAGFDPSGGAGVLADIKTFEANKCLGLGVVTGLTFQNEDEFEGVKWLETEEIIRQMDVLLRKYKIEFVKIGMIKNLVELNRLISGMTSLIPSLKIVWDPVIKASAGFTIHSTVERDKVNEVCKSIFMLTPNIDEIKTLAGGQDEMKAAKALSQYCHVFLKGGHSEADKGRDHLFTKEGKQFSFRPKKIAAHGKHGSGCVLSSAITARLALGRKLNRACLEGKDYVTRFLNSNKTLLGFHHV
ncbi:MAG: hydroxymethylpyrimidine/phosphomethylpyrimidine kinase [Bacteroidota bacterium]